MEKRSNESPMDFEWQTRAPGDVTSPFYQLAMAHEKENKKRPRSVFDSPAKPDKPSLRQPASQTFLFSRPQQSKVNFTRGSSFKTPRKIDLDFSSGAENPSSPDFADNDETPEKPSKSNRRDSLFNFYGRFAPSPGRGEIPRSNKFSNVLVNRVHKRRRREREIDRHLRRHSDDSIGDAPHGQRGSNSSQPKPTETPINHEIPFFSRLFTFLETHPHIPRILSYYAQFAFNLAIASITLYIIITFLLAIKGDFDNANTDASADILAEMSSCAKNFVENRCSGEEGRRLPALEVVCDNWERCMNRDPAKSRRVKVSAQTLAEIFNSFIEPIGFKTMFFFLASVTSCVAVSNLSFSFFRNKSNNPPPGAYQSSTPPDMHPDMHPQHSHLPYTPGRPGYSMENPYFPQTPARGFSQRVPMSTRRGDVNENDRKDPPRIEW